MKSSAILAATAIVHVVSAQAGYDTADKPLTFETTTSQHNIRRDEIVQQPISLANLETLDGARVIGEQLDGFCLIQYITVLVASDVIEEIDRRRRFGVRSSILYSSPSSENPCS